MKSLIASLILVLFSTTAGANQCPKRLVLGIQDFIPIQIYSSDRELQTQGRKFRARVSAKSLYVSPKHRLDSEIQNASCTYSHANSGAEIRFNAQKNELKMSASLGSRFPKNYVLELNLVINRVSRTSIEIVDERINLEVRDTKTGHRVFIGHGIPVLHVN